jgi:hypothetical protein
MGSVVISGATSGAVTLAVPAEAGTRTLTLPATTGTVLTNDISAAGDTSAGDAAAVGYTSAEGLILTGQGSTSDVTIKNDADATVLCIPTGTTNVGIGSANALDNLHVFDTTNSAIATQLLLQNQGALNHTTGIAFQVSSAAEVASTTYAPKAGILFERTTANGRGPIKFMLDNAADNNAFAGGDEVARLSGNSLFLGTTTNTANTTLVVQGNNGVNSCIGTQTDHAGSNASMYFMNSNGIVGSIATASSATSFNTTSDYRLKENVDYSWDATTRLKQLKPARFNFIADESDTLVDGFIAHEVSSIVPEAITGEKDGMKPEVLYVEGDELPDGKSIGDVKEASAPDYQGIDQSKLVPLLVKTIQELEARITALEA